MPVIGHHPQQSAVLHGHQQLAVGRGILVRGILQFLVEVLKGQAASKSVCVFFYERPDFGKAVFPVYDPPMSSSVGGISRCGNLQTDHTISRRAVCKEPFIKWL